VGGPVLRRSEGRAGICERGGGNPAGSTRPSYDANGSQFVSFSRAKKPTDTALPGVERGLKEPRDDRAAGAEQRTPVGSGLSAKRHDPTHHPPHCVNGMMAFPGDEGGGGRAVLWNDAKSLGQGQRGA